MIGEEGRKQRKLGQNRIILWSLTKDSSQEAGANEFAKNKNKNMFKIKDYILTPVDLYRGILHLVKKAGPKDIIGLAVLVGLFVFFRNYLEWQTDSSLFMLFWIALFYWNLDSRISIAGALISLVFCPIFLILENNYGFLMGEIWAEQSAVWAYYFLVIGVTKQIWEFRKESAEEKEGPETEEKTSENIQLRPKQSPASVMQETSGEKGKSLDELIEEIQRKENKRAQRNGGIAKQKRMMDIVPTKLSSASENAKRKQHSTRL